MRFGTSTKTTENTTTDTKSGEGEKRREVLPEGLYSITPAKWETRKMKNGKGEYLNVAFVVVEGGHEGQFIYHKFITKHTSEKALEYSSKQAYHLFKALGTSGSSLETTLGEARVKKKTVKVKVEIRTSDGYAPQNEITSFTP